jgi:hypothetical protein
MLELLDAKACEWCTDSHGFTYAFISTHVAKRVSKVEHVIEEWDSGKYRLYPFVGESKVVTFSKQPGQTPGDHFIVKTIKDHKNRSDGTSTYDAWACRSERPYKKRRVVVIDDDEPVAEPAAIQLVAEPVAIQPVSEPVAIEPAPLVIQATLASIDEAVIAAKDALIAHLQRALAERDAQIARLESTVDNVIAASQAAFNAFLQRHV